MVNDSKSEIYEQERRADGAAEFLHRAPSQTADEKEARSETAHHQQDQSQEELERQHIYQCNWDVNARTTDHTVEATKK